MISRSRCPIAMLGPALLMLIMTSSVQAADFSTTEVTISYAEPSHQAQPLFIFARGTPIEAVVVLDAWVKVRDSEGKLSWMQRSALSTKRKVIVQQPHTAIRQNPESNSAIAFYAEPHVILDWLPGAPPGWVKVQAANRSAGFARLADVWGE